MRVVKALIAVSLVAALASCSKATPPTVTPSPSPLQAPPAATQGGSIGSIAIENDRVCRSMYGLPCNALIHMLGPMNAQLRKETRACVGETVSVFVAGQWVADNKYQDPETGKRYGDHCIAVSL